MHRKDYHPQLLVESLFHASMTVALYFPSDRMFAKELADEAVELARRLGAPRFLTLALRSQGVAADGSRRPSVAGLLLLLTEALALARASGDNPRLVTTFPTQLAEAQFTAERYDEAVALGNEAAELAALTEYAQMVIFTKTNVAHYAVMTGDWETARRQAVEALRLATDAKSAYNVTSGSTRSPGSRARPAMQRPRPSCLDPATPGLAACTRRVSKAVAQISLSSRRVYEYPRAARPRTSSREARRRGSAL